MSPYLHDLTPIKDISPYFIKTNDGQMRFTGKTLELRIPMAFKAQDALIIGETVTTPGLFDMIFDDKEQAALNLLATITIIPSEIGKMTYKGIEYLVLHLKTGDTFMTSTRVLQDPHIVYLLWVTFVSKGIIPYNFSYSSLLSIFENVVELTGGGIGVSRSVFEAIIAYLSRDPDDIKVQYRNTDREKPFKFVAMTDFGTLTSSTIARLNGAYMRDAGLTSALRTQVEARQPFEDLLRGLLPAKSLRDDGTKFF